MDASLSRKFYVSCILFLLLPALIFLLGWVRPEISLPLALAGGVFLWRWLRTLDYPIIPFGENRRTLLRAFALTFLWVFASGIGGYTYQNYDHYNRNAILRDLTMRSWPVRCEEMTIPEAASPEIRPTLVYYSGFFLMPALGGKAALWLGGSQAAAMNAAFFLCFLEALFAVYATYLLISQWLGRFALWPLIFLIGFSGWDLIPYLLFFRPEVEGPEMLSVTARLGAFFGTHNAPHLEWFTHPWLNSSMTGLLFWVFNQSVPFLLGMMLFQTLRDWRGLLLVYAALFISAPFPSAGLFPLMAWQLLKNSNFQLPAVLRTLCSPLNLLSLPAIALIAAYYQGNVSCGVTHFWFPESAHLWLLFSVYFLTEYVVWFVCVGRKWDAELFICLLLLLVTSFFKLGGGSDFAMRTAIPCFAYLMLCVLRNWYSETTTCRTRILILGIFLIGCANPLMEFKRCAGNTLLTYAGLLQGSKSVAFSASPEFPDPDYYVRDERIHSIFELRDLKDPFWENFTGQSDSTFFRYLARK